MKRYLFTLQIFGVYGRNRTSKRTTIDLFDIGVDDPVSVARIEDQVKAQLASLKAKPGLIWTVTRYPMTVEQSGIGTSKLIGITEGVKQMSGVQL